MLTSSTLSGNEKPSTVLEIAQRELDDANARIAGLAKEHRILRHLRFREENMRIIKKAPHERTAEQQERVDHLVAANQNRSAALPGPSHCASAMPKSVRATAFAGARVEKQQQQQQDQQQQDHGSSSASASASGSTKCDAEERSARRRRPIKSCLSHVVNNADKISDRIDNKHRTGKMTVRVAPDQDISAFTMVFDEEVKKPSEIERLKKYNHHVLPRMIATSERGGDAVFDRTKHQLPKVQEQRPGSGSSSSASASASLVGAAQSSSPAASIAALSARRRAAAGHGKFKIDAPRPPQPHERAPGVNKMMYVARELNKNSGLMRPGDQFNRSESFETVTQSLRRYDMLNNMRHQQQRTKFDIHGTGAEEDASNSLEAAGEDGGVVGLGPPSTQTFVVAPKGGGAPRRFVRAGAYLIADRRREQWKEVDAEILAACPSRGLPKTVGVYEKGYGLMRKPRLGDDDDDDGARSVVSDLTGSTVTASSPRR